MCLNKDIFVFPVNFILRMVSAQCFICELLSPVSLDTEQRSDASQNQLWFQTLWILHEPDVSLSLSVFNLLWTKRILTKSCKGNHQGTMKDKTSTVFQWCSAIRTRGAHYPLMVVTTSSSHHSRGDWNSSVLSLGKGSYFLIL